MNEIALVHVTFADAAEAELAAWFKKHPPLASP